ncbi:MAG: helix-turn-helix transcriptional regulator [Lachnospiraceae bacterium]|nr:helix-turn-helix transcriptional regulator [Lachnospiraceae bacterium]
MVAEKVGANPSYVSRLFKEILGISFTSYLTNCRMEASLDLLAKKEIPIREVAEMSGFNTIQNYMRLFKKYYGMAPGQYRDSLQS